MQPPFVWDHYSDQPHVIKDKGYKRAMKKPHSMDYLKLFFTSVIILPIATLWMKLFRGEYPCDIGLCVNLDKGEEQVDLIEELGVKHLLIRFPLWEMERLDDFVRFAKCFGSDKKIVIAVLQDRENIEDLGLFEINLEKIFKAFHEVSDEYQIGNAINRTKWGFFSVSEYLNFYLVAQNLRDRLFPSIKLIGPSVIDFEYYYAVRALFNGYHIMFDKLSALLYVDRRGAPQNSQYLIFDTQNKIDLLYSLAQLSSKTQNEIYITEVNWPIKNTAPYAPTSERECVSEEEYLRYMVDYISIARNSGKISKLFWHQLIAPGYGLVDNRNGEIRKSKAFYAFKELLQTS